MKRSNLRKDNRGHVRLFCRTAIGAAVHLALYGVPQVVLAQEEPPAQAGLEEIIVTASRREQAVEEVPYNLTVIGGEDLSRMGVTDIASLARQVPGLSLYDFGSRYDRARTPIIRGLNASSTGTGGFNPVRAFRTSEQSPVSTYIGNSPINGYFQLDDIQRIEVLRGPQGTLYGAGALGGAVRIIPNAPELGEFSGHLDASLGTLAHSSDLPYTAGGTLNVPIGDTLAVRVTGKYAYDPGFIDVSGILERTSNDVFGAPVLADPADPVDSPGVFTGKDDWNDQRTFTGRASLLWEPIDKFRADLAVTYADLDGDGGPLANSAFPGGPYPFDPRITFPRGGDYQGFAAIDQPYSRETILASLDLTYDAGFATLSSTSSYYSTEGSTLTEVTYFIGGISFFAPYYAGIPINPRFVHVNEFLDTEHAFTQEVRLVSATSPEKRLDYVLGAFYQKQSSKGVWTIASPGSHERSVSQGCTAPVFFGSSFPNCLTTVGPNDSTFVQPDNQQFEEVSVFGELTWHVTDQGQLTFGGRYFDQDFTDNQSYLYPTFNLFAHGRPNDSHDSGTIWKVNPSYEYIDNHRVYATWSQGFRRGGANAFPLEGFARESPLLLTYKPDQADNYEIGLKGRFANGITYSLAGFYIDWSDPQIGGSLPSGNLAVFNANEAESKGFELESSGPLLFPDLSYAIGFSYVDAKLTKDFALPGNTGFGQIVPGLISGKDGEPLPGVPETSVTGTITYERNLAPGYDLSISVNGSYRSSVPIFRVETQSERETEAYAIVNLSSTLSHEPWTLVVYVTNLTDKRAILLPPYAALPFVIDEIDGPLGLDRPELLNRPREVGLRISYRF